MQATRNLSATEGVETLDKNPIFADEKAAPQKSGTATDDQAKKRQQSQDVEEVGTATASSRGRSANSATSFMDEVAKLHTKVDRMSNLKGEDLGKQARDVIQQIESVKTQLSNAQGEIKPAYKTLLNNKLTHIDDNLRIALSKAGVEYVPPPSPQTGVTNPIERFLGFLTNTQYQLTHLEQSISSLNLTGNNLTPANMLALQIKVGYVQQQIELFTSLLNKALESTKTIMNVQI